MNGDKYTIRNFIIFNFQLTLFERSIQEYEMGRTSNIYRGCGMLTKHYLQNLRVKWLGRWVGR